MTGPPDRVPQAAAPHGPARPVPGDHGDPNDPGNLPILMAYPGARLLGLSRYGLDPVTIEQTQHVRLIREFCLAPATFVETMMEE